MMFINYLRKSYKMMEMDYLVVDPEASLPWHQAMVLDKLPRDDFSNLSLGANVVGVAISLFPYFSWNPERFRYIFSRCYVNVCPYETNANFVQSSHEQDS